ncbi:apolipoprotein L3-like isoform X2 [Gambusia affinis]|uniref:apolipoprotein L3-like isoform X2 n=1 Tax=Gambusia affinis TaxID=33528 RepID=UPI001CDD4A15|nr:apolipoprotein L3-like isoform X2 [Gambusia affinis]
MERPPVPLPRKIRLQTRSVDDEWLKRDPAAPQSENGSEDSTPPLGPSRTNVRRQYSEQYENIREQVQELFKPRPPPLPARPPLKQLSQEPVYMEVIQDETSSDEEMKPWKETLKDFQRRGFSEIRMINAKAEKLYKAIQTYIQLISKHAVDLKSHIKELNNISDNLDKFAKKTKIAGITGGASTAAGGVAAAAGVILAPFTAGASLALTVVGAGVVAAGGVTGASAAIANKANLNQDKKKIDKTLNDFSVRYEEILTSLMFINEGMDLLKQHGVTLLNETMMDSKAAACAVQLATGEASAMASEKSSNASGMLKGFAIGMDFYFTKDKDGQKLKKGLESKLAQKLRKLVGDLDTGLDELVKIKDVFCKHVD